VASWGIQAKTFFLGKRKEFVWKPFRIEQGWLLLADLQWTGVQQLGKPGQLGYA